MAKKKPAAAKSATTAQVKLIREESPVAQRQPKTDPLILGRLLKAEGEKHVQDEQHRVASHAILVRWADLESTGKLDKFHETQLQGSFLAEVFGEALGYTQPVEGAETYYQVQHEAVGRETPDALLGKFRHDAPRDPLAVVEFKGPKVHLDRDRASGRTAIDQCWDYLVNTPPACRWGIVSNIVSFRLYERDSTKRVYEHFTLQELRDPAAFRRFYALFHRQGLVEGQVNELPRTVRLLRETNNRQREVSESLYESYSQQRMALIAELITNHGQSQDDAVEMAQRLLDRIIFIAFCEDRSLLPERTIARAHGVNGFSAVVNPRWQSFKALFRHIDGGNVKYDIDPYNGGLFAAHPVDQLELADQWTDFFKNVSEFDFRDEVNLDVLGHLFERSITELERLKEGGLFGDREKQQQYAQMPQSVRRKQLGVYYTPPELTLRIVQYTVDELIDARFAAAAVRHGVKPADAKRGVAPDEPDYWRECLAILRDLKIVDPACGSGAFLFQAYNALEQRYNEVIGHLEHLESNPPPSKGGARGGIPDAASSQCPADLERHIPHFILNDNLYGVDLSPEAVEITQLALWIRSATRGQTLASLSKNIVHGNSLVHDPAVHPNGFDWRERFPEVFQNPPPSKGGARGGTPDATIKLRASDPNKRHDQESLPHPLPSREPGFDCVIGNPPWERIKLQEREFFSLPRPDIATATNAAKRRQLIATLEADDPELFTRYQQAQAAAESLLTYCRTSDKYPLTGKGDINLYAVFAELAHQLVAPHGRVGLLTPSGIASDMTTKDFFAAIADSNRLIRLYDFENKKVFFPDVHASFKFCILNFTGSAATLDEADFVFFAHGVEELEDQSRHVKLSGDDIRLLNPNTRTCPIFRSKRDAEITKAIYRSVPVLIDQNREGPTGNPWGVTFKRMFDQTNDAELFREANALQAEGFNLRGNRWAKGKQECLPLYEAKMVQAYDHRAADVVTDEANWVRQGQTARTSLVSWQNPEHLATPRFWVDNDAVSLQAFGSLGFKDITSPTNQRTMIAAWGPLAGYTNHFVLISTESSASLQTCLLANLNSFAFDYCARQKIGGVTLNFFIVEQLPAFAPDSYDKPCPWRRKQTLETWISERALKLTCTAEDMLPLADACGFTAGSFQKEYGGRLNKWDPEERAQLMAELDAAYFHLYGTSRDDAEYILSTFNGIHDRTTLLPGHKSTAEQILALYDQYAAL